MILDWVAQSGLFALAAAVVFVPGLLIGAALRLRGMTLWATAPAISVGVLAGFALLFPFASVRWGLLSAGAGVSVVAAVAWLVTRTLRPNSPSTPPRELSRGSLLLLAAGLVVGGGLNAARLMTYVGRPDAISQTNDAVFHLNALRWIGETGSASSLDISGLIGADSFYPAAWHAVTSLVAVDVDVIPTAANMVALVFAALVWPVGIAFLTRIAARGGVRIAALAAALSAGLMAFPQLMFEWGVLYPYAVSIAVLPATVACTILIFRTWRRSVLGDGARSSVALILASGAGVVAITLSQPSSILIWALLVMLWATGTVLLPEHPRERRAAWSIIALIGGWSVLAIAWIALAYLAGPVLWKPYRSVAGAAADVVLNSHSQLPAAPVVSALLILGLIVALRDRRMLWLAAAWVAISVLYVVSVGTDLPVIKRVLTGPWYGDSFRLAAVVPLIVVPLAAIGLHGVIRWAADRPWRVTAGRTRELALAAIAAVAVAGSVAVALAPVVLLRVAAETDEQSRYTLNDRSYLSEDEYELLRRVPDLVPSDALIIANPSTGAAFAYVLGEREIIPRTWSPPQSTAWDVIALHLRSAGEDPAVCDALVAYGSPSYVLDFGIGGTGPGEYLMPGMTDFDGQAGFEEVAREGEVSLWRIDACD
ncbi:DUF6541 family protein [Microbacterium sp. WCS2018Hpa-23]|uniref:DUF6541 family protein n=1 Tax=Microbacterium sp. WCS2018Hpa-23 TaxID=3073634 RepID=UPI0028831771|nr:DUF6541 family protein [Microbacterium sp. WCS2018Hpa-23]